MPGKGARGGADMRRAAAVLLLVAVAAIGLRAGGTFSAAEHPQILGLSGHVLYWTIAVAEVVLALVGIALLIARLIWGRGDKPLPRRRRSLWWLLLLPLMVFGLAKILRMRQRPAPARATATHAATTAGAVAHHPQGNPWPLLVLFAALAIVAVALINYRRRRPRLRPAPDEAAAADATVAPLAAALAAGERALHEDSDPRSAIIGCYAAMERRLADAGSPPRLADTPAEVLGRATASGLVRPAWAGTLTALFRRARYSSHPMTEADRAAAIGALAQVQADLGGGG